MKLAKMLDLAVEYVTDLVFADDGTATCKGADDNDLTAQVGWHLGFYSRPSDAASGVVLKAGGKGGLSFLVGWRNRQYEISLQKGEVGVQNEFGASTLWDKNGNITSVPGSGGKILLGAASSTQPSVLGNSLETRLSDLESKFLSHVHPLSLVPTTCPAGAGTASGTSQATATSLPHSGDVIKSGKVEVAP